MTHLSESTDEFLDKNKYSYDSSNYISDNAVNKKDLSMVEYQT